MLNFHWYSIFYKIEAIKYDAYTVGNKIKRYDRNDPAHLRSNNINLGLKGISLEEDYIAALSSFLKFQQSYERRSKENNARRNGILDGGTASDPKE